MLGEAGEEELLVTSVGARQTAGEHLRLTRRQVRRGHCLQKDEVERSEGEGEEQGEA